MYCAVEKVSTFLTFDRNGMLRKGAAFVSTTKLFSIILLCIIKVCIRTMSLTSTTNENTHTLKSFFVSRDMT